MVSLLLEGNHTLLENTGCKLALSYARTNVSEIPVTMLFDRALCDVVCTPDSQTIIKMRPDVIFCELLCV